MEVPIPDKLFYLQDVEVHKMYTVFFVLCLLFCVTVTFISNSYCMDTKCNYTRTLRCDILANCSGLKQKEILLINKNVTCIDLSKNRLYNVNRAAFYGFKNLTFIDLSRNVLKNIEEGAFSDLENLNYLDISFNINLGLAVLPNVTFGLNQTNIKVFKFEQITCPGGRSNILRRHHLINLDNTLITELSIASNRIEMFDPCVIFNLPKTIKKLSIAENRLIVGKYVLEYYLLTGVEIINASLRNTPARFIDSLSRCEENVDAFTCTSKTYDYSCQKNLSLSSMHHNGLISVSIPQNLQIVYANSSKLYTRVTKFQLKKNNLREIYFQNNVIHSWIGPIQGVENITILDMSKNFCSKLSNDIAEHLTGLLKLKLAENSLGSKFQFDMNGKILRNLRRLQHLDISFNRIQALPFLFMKNLCSLVYLDISHNLISDWNMKMGHMKKLSVLNLSQNRLGTISKQGMEELNKLFAVGNLSVDLKDNRLMCTCDNLDFLEWMLKYKAHFKNYKTYNCSNARQNSFQFHDLHVSVEKLKKDCKSYTAYYILVSITLSSLLSLVICIALYRNRWKIRYLRYTLLQNRRSGYLRLQTSSDNRFLYDAFVSYTSKDREFVIKDMIQNLEQVNGFQLLIRDRSFIPGESKSLQIVRSIQESRKTVCIVSKRYLKSAWRDYELNMARVEGVEARNTLRYVILILLPEVYSGGYPKKISDFLKKNCFIEYPDDPAGYEEFWQNLSDRLRECLHE
ncbi:toll-like receptor 4 [Saccostrea echinata]|uniref:toll-like receptor 4 n=1 Tax=Saccostrea echinata TaxID=191078 RepID=UPI002A7F54AB|nr:toll-like receptor 4 [Saccostrea echinata]